MKASKLDIYMTFFKIGLFTFGGGYAMLPLIEREMVDRKKWVKEEDIVDVFALSQTMPGAIALNSSTLIGYRLGGMKASLCAMLGVITPSIIIITLIALFFNSYLDEPIVKAAFIGIRSGIVALVLKAGLRIAKAAVKDRLTLILCILAVFSIVVLDMNAIFLIIAGGSIGGIIYNIYPKKAQAIIERGHLK